MGRVNDAGPTRSDFHTLYTSAGEVAQELIGKRNKEPDLLSGPPTGVGLACQNSRSHMPGMMKYVL